MPDHLRDFVPDFGEVHGGENLSRLEDKN